MSTTYACKTQCMAMSASGARVTQDNVSKQVRGAAAALTLAIDVITNC